ncbi:MAG: lasso peptide biosynthesis B2 protein [Nitrospira sp.]|nr:lasso peptide biosynthesis B2 protein [Nitrospira sp.]
MLSALRRHANRTFIEQVLFLQLTALSLGLIVALAFLTLPRLTSLLSRIASSPLRLIPLLHTRYTIDQLIPLIDSATSLSHRERRCLPRSLLLFWLLCSRQETADLCVGISTNNAALQGHAWVELKGAVLGDTRSYIDRYALLLRLSA